MHLACGAASRSKSKCESHGPSGRKTTAKLLSDAGVDFNLFVGEESKPKKKRFDEATWLVSVSLAAVVPDQPWKEVLLRAAVHLTLHT
jgi:hypothetical protein